GCEGWAGSVDQREASVDANRGTFSPNGGSAKFTIIGLTPLGFGVDCGADPRGLLLAVAEEAVLLDDFDDGGRDHLFPGDVAGLDAGEHVAGVDEEVFDVVLPNGFDAVVLEKVP